MGVCAQDALARASIIHAASRIRTELVAVARTKHDLHLLPHCFRDALIERMIWVITVFHVTIFRLSIIDSPGIRKDPRALPPGLLPEPVDVCDHPFVSAVSVF